MFKRVSFFWGGAAWAAAGLHNIQEGKKILASLTHI